MNPRVAAALAAVIALLVVAGCAGEAQEDNGLATKLASADQLFKNREYEAAGVLFEEIADEARGSDNSAFVEAASMRARSYLIAGDKEAGLDWLGRAGALASQSDPAGWSRYLGVRGRFEWKDGDNETATDTFGEMFDYCGEKELWERAVDAAHMIAITGDQTEKFDWSRKGIEMAEKGGMDGWLGPLWNNLGWNYYDAERYDEAHEALVNARSYHYKSENDLPKLIADYSVAHVTMKQGDLDAAKSGMLEVLDWATRLDADGQPDAVEWMGFARWDLGEMAIELGDEAGADMLRQALGEIEQSGMPDWDPDQWKQKQDRVAELGT